MSNTYSDSYSNRLTTQEINNKVTLAKAEKLETMEYPYCETCKQSTNTKLDMSHLISVNECKINPDIPLELAWFVPNIIIECRKCHNITESQSHIKRKERYNKVSPPNARIR